MPTKSHDEAEEIYEWLKQHNFRPSKTSTASHAIVWVRNCCQVQVRQDEQSSYLVDIRAGADSEWASLDQVLSRVEEDPYRLVRSPIEVAVAHFLNEKVSRTPPLGTRLYAACRPCAYFAKVILQMLIGLGAIAGLCWALIQTMGNYHGQDTWTSAAHISILVITASLAAAGAVELAYTLYTPGPDEALDPLMLGLSAGILLLVTRPDVPVAWQFLGVILGVISLGALFLVRRHFIDSDEP